MKTRFGYRPMFLSAMVMLLAMALLLAGCGGQGAGSDDDKAGMPNPASVYCEEHGGRVDIRTDSDGGQYGMCIFEDGSECDEWAYFRGECSPAGRSEESDGAGMANPASIYCEEHGGRVEDRTDDQGGQYGVCIFEDGSECDEWEYFRGDCFPEGESEETGQLGMANPASVYCEEHGGRVDIRTDDQGGQYGVCVFDDGSECDEWAFYREECKPGDSLTP